MSILAEFAIFPMDKGADLSAYAARAIRIIQQSGLQYAVGSMGTVVEGEWSEVMACLTRCHEELAKDCDRIYISMNIDSRKNRTNGLREKIRSVEQRLDAKGGL